MLSVYTQCVSVRNILLLGFYSSTRYVGELILCTQLI